MIFGFLTAATCTILVSVLLLVAMPLLPLGQFSFEVPIFGMSLAFILAINFVIASILPLATFIVLAGLLEMSRCRSLWPHLFAAQVATLIGGWHNLDEWRGAWPLETDEVVLTASLFGALSAAALVGGSVYWTIAGRTAGLRAKDSA